MRGIRILGAIFFNFLIFMLFTIPSLDVLTDGLQRHQHLWCPVVMFIIPYKVFESIKNILILKKFTHPSCCTDVISYKPQLPDNILSLHHKNSSNPIDILGFPCYNKTEIKHCKDFDGDKYHRSSLPVSRRQCEPGSMNL